VRRALLALALILASCGGSRSPGSGASIATATTSTTTSTVAASGLHLTSHAFRTGGAIPRVYTCDGSDAVLPLRWSGVPAGTKELTLVMRDPDAPGGTFVHWAVAGIPASATSVPARNVILGRNGFGSLGYRGPCPPAGDRAHHYVLTLGALVAPSGLRPGFNPDQLQTRALGIATLIGTYARH
jgi:Raf kinase inhibitor-like YbhB/YbcL family protein